MKNAVKSLTDIIRYLYYILNKKRRKQFVILFVLTWIGAGVEMLGISAVLPFVQAMMSLDKMMNNQNVAGILQYFHITSGTTLILLLGVGIIVIYVAKNLYLLALALVTARYQTGVQKDLAIYMLHQYVKRPYIYFVNNNSNVIMRNIDFDTNGISVMIQSGMKVLSEALTVLLVCGLLFVTDAGLAGGIMVIAAACMLSIVFGCRNKIKENGAAQRHYAMMKSKSLRELLEGIKEVQVMNRRDWFVEGYETNVDKNRKTVVVQNMLNILPEKTIEAVCIAGLIGMVCFRILQGTNPQDFVPQLAVFAVAAFRILPSIARIVSNLNTALFQKPALQSVYENLKDIERYNTEMQEIYDRASVDDSLQNVLFEHELTIRAVSWQYPGAEKEVLSGLNMVIKKNQSVAFIGESGSGKTTLGDIILGLFRPQKGQVLLDGIDIITIPANWSRLVGFVPQAVFLTDDTIRSNVAFGIDEKQIDDEKVWRALEQAQLKRFVETLPDGLETIVGEDGIKFSGGQKQRIAIARALYNEPEILLLDEATAALDTETETAVMESIEALQGRITMIIIAHRLTTIRKCDAIYEIKEGKAVKQEKAETLRERM